MVVFAPGGNGTGGIRVEKTPLHVIQAKRLKNFYLMLTAFFVAVQVVWVGVPIVMAVLWSLVDPKNPWSYPNIIPPGFSFEPWKYVFSYTNIGRALRTSYSVAPLAVLLSFTLSLPTSYILGRKNIPGKKIFMLVVLLPIIMPGMVIALFLSRVFTSFGLSQTFFGLVLAHTLMSMPYMIRVMTRCGGKPGGKYLSKDKGHISSHDTARPSRGNDIHLYNKHRGIQPHIYHRYPYFRNHTDNSLLFHGVQFHKDQRFCRCAHHDDTEHCNAFHCRAVS